jgi:hypothetical protein
MFNFSLAVHWRKLYEICHNSLTGIVKELLLTRELAKVVASCQLPVAS